MKVIDYIEQINDEEIKEGAFKLYELIVRDYGFLEKPAARGMHQAYKGGLHQHTCQVIEGALDINELYDRPFKDDEVILAGFLHDLDKLFVYHFDEQNNIVIEKKPLSGISLVLSLCIKVGLMPPVEVISAVEFAHGGWSDFSHNRSIRPCGLHVIIHAADSLSTFFGEGGIKNKGGIRNE